MMENFPANFRWGVATSSYQIEGAAHEDGRGTSIWDTFAATPGKVINGENGDVACDHYHRFPEDIAVMKSMGIQSYRFSMAWPRMFPNGDHRREQRGFDFYNRLIDGLLEAGIEPLATLYHWDMPQALQDEGGWANRNTVHAFADYAASAAVAFGDRVTDWITLNEPWCVTWLGYMSGVHAPGVQDLDSAIAAAHHTALAHGIATRAMRAERSNIRTGIAANMTNYRVDDPSNSELMVLQGLMDSHLNRWWIDAFSTGQYPQNLVDLYGEKLQRVMKPGDERLLKVDSEILGVNYYSDSFLGTPDPEDKPMIEGGLFPFPQRASGRTPEPRTDMGWPVTPEGLGELVLRIARDWPHIDDIRITENGAAYPEGPDADGDVADDRRVEYLKSHIDSLGRAIAEGAPVRQYFAWSLMDNYEWAEGYEKRFGLVHVDFQTQKRTVKRSGIAYNSIIAAHEALRGVEQPV